MVVGPRRGNQGRVGLLRRTVFPVVLEGACGPKLREVCGKLERERGDRGF